MAKKAFFHLATFQDGYKNWEEIIPAKGSASIRTAPRSPNVKLTRVNSLGWHAVATMPSDTDEVMFQATIGDKELTFEKGQSGYSYLFQQFPEQVGAVKDFIKGPEEA